MPDARHQTGGADDRCRLAGAMRHTQGELAVYVRDEHSVVIFGAGQKIKIVHLPCPRIVSQHEESRIDNLQAEQVG